MSHRALVAVKQSEGTFNVHYSQNGAEEVQLLDELRECLNVHGRVDWVELTGSTIADWGQQIAQAEGSKYTVESGDSGNVVEPQPSATRVPRDQLVLASDLLEFEVLYVVEDGQVDAYWLTWTYPDVIRPWREHIEVEVYRANAAPDSPEAVMEYIEESDPVRTIGDFERGWLSDEVVRNVVKDYHRWMYELHAMASREVSGYDVDDAEEVQRVIQTPEYWLVFRADTNESLVPSSYPFMLPVEIGTPPNRSSNQIRDSAAQSRFQIGAELNAINDVSEDDEHRAYAEALMEIVDAHLDSLATEFVPGPLEQVIDEYKQTREMERMQKLWKN